jgi:hypothetical protein
MEYAAHRFPMTNIQLVKGEARLSLKLSQPPLLQARVVGVVNVIYAGNAMALRQQQFCHFRANKAGAAGYQVVSHRSFITCLKLKGPPLDCSQGVAYKQAIISQTHTGSLTSKLLSGYCGNMG